MNKEDREDVYQDIRDMLAEGLYAHNIANYLGVPLWMVKYVKDPARHKASANKWREENLERAREIQEKASSQWKSRNPTWQKEYSKKYYARSKEKKAKAITEYKNRAKQSLETDQRNHPGTV